MARGAFNLQDSFLNQLRRDGIQVTIYLVNGVQIRGYVRGSDNFTVVVESDAGKQLLIYKHALSTLVPAEPVALPTPAEARAEAARSSGGAQARGA